MGVAITKGIPAEARSRTASIPTQLERSNRMSIIKIDTDAGLADFKARWRRPLFLGCVNL